MIEIIIILFCLLCAGFFAGTETAFITRLYRVMSGIAEWWRQRPEKLLATTLIGTNLALIVASSLATEKAIEIWGTIGKIYTIITLSIISLIVCETLPKSAALRWSEKWTQIAALPLLIFRWILIVVIELTAGFSRLVTAILDKIGADEYPRPVEMMDALRKPVRGLDEGRLLALFVFLRFAERKIKDIMIPLGKLSTLPIGAPVKEAHEILNAGIPYIVISDGDNPVGVLDAATAGILSPHKKITISDISTLFVPEIKDVMDYISEVSFGRFVPALVVDEFGAVVGAVGGQPIMARIMRTKTAPMQKTLRFPNTSILLSADTPIEKLEVMTGIAFPRGQYQTLGGFITEIMHKIPKPKESLVWQDLRFEIISADRRKIRRVKVTRIC